MFYVYFSSGSVKVHFIIHFHQDVQINRETESRLADILKEGVVGSLYVIDTHSLQLTPVGKYRILPVSHKGEVQQKLLISQKITLKYL